MFTFVKRHLDPVDRLGEVLFGLIMALGFTGAVRLGTEHVTNRELLAAIFGCNLAWAVVDGVMYVMLRLFELGRRARVIDSVAKSRSDDAALEQIAAAFDETVGALMTSQERDQLYRNLLANVRTMTWDPPQLSREDLLGGVAAGLAVLLATLPILVPFVLVENTDIAVRLSNLIALAMLFALGCWWGRIVARNPWRIGAGMTVVGLVLVATTIALGG